MKDIFDLGLHESALITHTLIAVRVVSGWIYSIKNEGVWNSVFVPDNRLDLMPQIMGVDGFPQERLQVQ